MDRGPDLVLSNSDAQALADQRREARIKVRTRALDKDDEGMLMAMLGIGDEDPMPEARHTPLVDGFDARSAKHHQHYASGPRK